MLDLGSGGGIDVLLSARRVGETGKAYGLDMTDEMLSLARRNQREAGVENVEFVKGTIEDVPLPDDSVDVIISNCVINLSGDKPAVFRESARVLKPGGRFAVSDVIADPDMDEATRQDMEQWTGCIAGALTREAVRARAAPRRGSRASRSRRPTACTSTPAPRSSALRSQHDHGAAVGPQPAQASSLDCAPWPRSVISARGLRKSYGDFEAVRGIDLEVSAGEVFAFLGPNGAGKTTTVEILEGYRERSEGEVSVLGADPGRGSTRAWRERIGIVLQECRLTPELTVTRGRRPVRRLLPGATRRGRDRQPGRPRREGRDQDLEALGRTAAPPRRGDGAGRRPGAALPRRADHRLRPHRPAPGPGR